MVPMKCRVETEIAVWWLSRFWRECVSVRRTVTDCRNIILVLSSIWFCVSVEPPAAAAEEMLLRVMTFNIWQGGEAGGQPLSQTAEVIRQARADVVGVQETHGREKNGVRTDNGNALADQLGWHYQPQAGRIGVLSRFPITAAAGRKHGVTIEYSPGRSLSLVNVHFAASPYQPYQLLSIPYGKYPFITTESAAIEWAERARGDEVDRVLEELHPLLSEGTPVLLTGDFNEPSYLDWTERSRSAGLCPLAVRYPTTQRIAATGLRDTFRTVHSDEVRSPGYTWTPTTSVDDPQDHHDRIDFVFASQPRIEILSCQVVGESNQAADIVVTPWPSDHRAVVTTVRVLPASSSRESR